MQEKSISQINKGLTKVVENADKLSKEVASLADKINSYTASSYENVNSQIVQQGVDPFIFAITIFILSCFIGYYVIWKVTPALHTPLMSVTNAISGIIIVGAMFAAGMNGLGFAKILGFLAVLIASINIFGGFVVTQRMLSMFRKN